MTRPTWTARALVAAVLAAVFAAPALADEPKPKAKKDPEKVFRKRDADGDGSLTLEEFRGKGKKADPAKVEKRFKKLDKDGDSKLTLAEMKAGAKPKKKA